MKTNYVFLIIWFVVVLTLLAVLKLPMWVELPICAVIGWYGSAVANKLEVFFTACKISLNKWARK